MVNALLQKNYTPKKCHLKLRLRHFVCKICVSVSDFLSNFEKMNHSYTLN